MSAAASAEALYARLESDVSKAVTSVDLTLQSGLPTADISILPEAYFPTSAVFVTVAEIRKTVAASDRVPNASGK